MPSMIKPRTLAVLAKAERRKVGASYIVTAMGMFDLAQPQADRFESEQALWLLSAKALPKGAVLDMGMPKPRAELLVGGSAKPVGGEPATAMIVEWLVGPLRKRLIVSGDRYWTVGGAGYTATPPKPFSEMPLSPEFAFGGPGHPDNPGGRGYRAGERLRARELVALPNIENAEQPVQSTDSSPAPALCGPIDPASPKRRRYAGTYDAHWLKHVAPALPDDVDPRLFLAAPDDQVFADHLAGGEPYVLRGFCADHAELRGQLPAFRVRCFLARKGKGEAPGELVEMVMRTDTLWLFAGARRGVLVYRGALPVEDIDADDLSHVMVAYERAGEEPRSFAHYYDVWQLRRDPETAHKYAFAEGQLAPPLRPEIVERRNAERAALGRARFEKHKAGQAWMLNKQLDEAGVPEILRPSLPEGGEFDEDLENLPLPTPEELEEGEVDLAGLLDAMQALEKKMKEKTDDFVANADEVRGSLTALQTKGSGVDKVDALFAALDKLSGGETAKSLDAATGPLSPPSPSASADLGLQEKIAATAERARNWRQGVLDALAPPAQDDEADFEAARARFLALPESMPFAEARQSIEAAKARLPALPASDGGAAAAAGTPPSLEALLDGLALDTDAGAAQEGAADLTARRGKANEKLRATLPNLPDEGSAIDAILAGMLPSSPGADAAPRGSGGYSEKLDASSAELDARESNVIEGLASMRRASLEAIYPQKPMSRTLARRLGDLILAEQRKGLDMRGRDLAGADLRGADLAGVDLEGALLERADLSGARLAGARLTKAALTSATLDGADLSDVDLSKANLAKCRARNARFTRCRLTDTILMEADFTGANFQGAYIEKVQALKSTFDDVDFSGATIRSSTFMQTSMASTIWRNADLEGVPFMDLSLAAAQFCRARLFRCIFLKVQAAESDFEEADLTRSSFNGEVDLTGARFTRAIASDSTFHAVKLTDASFELGTFNRATFVKSELTGADFHLASLKGAMFGNAKLAGSSFIGANLLKARLRRADLSGARMIGANLYGADLDHTILTAADLTGVNLDKTILAVDTNAG